jgi:hypothetical protein
MAHRYKKSEIDGATVYDPLPKELIFMDVPTDQKVSDLILGLMRVAYLVKLAPRVMLTWVHLSFTSDLRLRQWAQGNGHPFIDGEGRAITCDGVVLHGSLPDLLPSPYTTDTILQDKGFADWFFSLFGRLQSRPAASPAPTAPRLPVTFSPLSRRPSTSVSLASFTPDQQLHALARASYDAFLNNINANVENIRSLDTLADQTFTIWLV